MCIITKSACKANPVWLDQVRFPEPLVKWIGEPPYPCTCICKTKTIISSKVGWTSPPCQAPCRRGRACQGSRNKASPEDDVDGADGEDNDFFETKFEEIIHLDHRERVRSCEVTLASEISRRKLIIINLWHCIALVIALVTDQWSTLWPC